MQSTDQDAAGVEEEPAPAEPPDPRAALDSYLKHRPGCVDCVAARRCDAAGRLWAAYKAATGTM